MVKFLFWKERAVHNIVCGAVFLFIFQNAVSQSVFPASGSPKITLHCEALNFQDVLTQLETMTGLHFVYSSNKVPVHKPVSIKVFEKPLDEVLDLLGNEMDLVFKRSGQHVVIKNRPFPVSQYALQSKNIPEAKTSGNPERKLSASAKSMVHQASFEQVTADTSGYPILSLSKDDFKKPLLDFSLYFDTTKLSGLPKRYVKSVNLKNAHSGWFVSAGFLINDYSAGAELQAGLRSVYLVYVPAWLKDGQYHGAYGVGTSLLLKRNLSLNTVYTYAFLKDEENYAANTFETISKEGQSSSSKHHQFRLTLQYSLTRNLSLRAGVILNHLATTHHLPERNLVTYRFISVAGRLPVTNRYSSFPYSQAGISEAQQTPPRFQTFSMWMGWETGISYRLNFYRH